MDNHINSDVKNVERTPDIFYKDRPQKNLWSYVKDIYEETHGVFLLLIFFGILDLLKPHTFRPMAYAVAMFLAGVAHHFLDEMIIGRRRAGIARLILFWAGSAV